MLERVRENKSFDFTHSGVQLGMSEGKMHIDLGIISFDNILLTGEEVASAFDESAEKFNKYTQYLVARLKMQLADKELKDKMNKVANKPEGGMIKSAVMTEKEFQNDETVTGEIIKHAREQKTDDPSDNKNVGDS